MQRNRIVIDCDPGIDDTFALILCIKKLDVAGIVAVGGNTGLQFTSRNARYVTELTGRTDIPVYAGYDQPMLGNAVRAEYVHGVGGLGDLDIPEPKKQLEKEHGVDFLIRTFMNENDVSLVAIGPLTNGSRRSSSWAELHSVEISPRWRNSISPLIRKPQRSSWNQESRSGCSA